MADSTIADEHVLPCDFIVGHVRFRKGVKLETVRQAAIRWFDHTAAHYAQQRVETALAALSSGDSGNG